MIEIWVRAGMRGEKERRGTWLEVTVHWVMLLCRRSFFYLYLFWIFDSGFTLFCFLLHAGILTLLVEFLLCGFCLVFESKYTLIPYFESQFLTHFASQDKLSGHSLEVEIRVGRRLGDSLAKWI